MRNHFLIWFLFYNSKMPHSAMVKSGPGLYEFLIEAELQQYYSTIKNDLKVVSIKI